jgi:hypothetical protein
MTLCPYQPIYHPKRVAHYLRARSKLIKWSFWAHDDRLRWTLSGYDILRVAPPVAELSLARGAELAGLTVEDFVYHPETAVGFARVYRAIRAMRAQERIKLFKLREKNKLADHLSDELIPETAEMVLAELDQVHENAVKIGFDPEHADPTDRLLDRLKQDEGDPKDDGDEEGGEQ